MSSPKSPARSHGRALEFEAIVYGHSGQQGIVAWSSGVSEELRRQIDRVVGGGMHSERSSNEWYAWYPIESCGWVAVAGFRTTDVRAQRAAPAYLAAIVPPTVDEPVIRQPFHLLRKLRELVATGRYHEARGTIDSLPIEAPPLQVRAPVEAIRQACEETSSPVFVPLLASVLASRPLVVVSRLGQTRIGGVIEALVWMLPLARVRQFAFTTELADRGHTGLRLGFVPGDNRFAGMDSNGCVVDLTLRQPEWGRDAADGTSFRAEAESRWRILQDPNLSEGFLEFLGDRAQPPQPPQPPPSQGKVVPPHEAIERVFRLSHSEPVKALMELIDLAPKDGSKAGPWKSPRLNQTLELILQGIQRLDDLGIWMDALVRFDGRISPGATQRIQALYRLGDGEARRALLEFVRARTRNGRNWQLNSLDTDFQRLEPELVLLKGMTVAPPPAEAPAKAASGMDRGTHSPAPSPERQVASTPNLGLAKAPDDRAGPTQKTPQSSPGLAKYGDPETGSDSRSATSGSRSTVEPEPPSGFWRRLFARMRRRQTGSPSKGIWTNLTIVVAIAGTCGFVWLLVYGPHNARKPQSGVASPARPTNSLGMTFIALPGSGAWLAGREVRVSDYAEFAPGDVRSGRLRNSGGPGEAADGPLLGVSWDEAMEFCRRLTKEEREAGLIRSNQLYRLPTHAEWGAGVPGTGTDRLPNWEWCWDGPIGRPERRFLRGGPKVVSNSPGVGDEPRQDAEANRRLDAGFRVVLDEVRDPVTTGGGR